MTDRIKDPRKRGRSKGQRFSSTLVHVHRSTLVQQAAAAGILPLEYMLSVIRSENPERIKGESAVGYANRLSQHIMLRLSASRYAAPYVHQRIATTVNLNTDIKTDKPVDILELAKSVAFVLTMAEREQRRTFEAKPTQLQ